MEQPYQVAHDPQTMIKQLAYPLYDARGWIKLLAVVMILNGVMLVFTIVGIIVCWLPIWLGVLLWNAAGETELAAMGGDQTRLLTALQKLRLYFVINGVLMLITLVLMVGMVVFGGAMLALLGSGLSN